MEEEQKGKQSRVGFVGHGSNNMQSMSLRVEAIIVCVIMGMSGSNSCLCDYGYG